MDVIVLLEILLPIHYTYLHLLLLNLVDQNNVIKLLYLLRDLRLVPLLAKNIEL